MLTDGSHKALIMSGLYTTISTASTVAKPHKAALCKTNLVFAIQQTGAISSQTENLLALDLRFITKKKRELL